jgi:hypothetical protein
MTPTLRIAYCGECCDTAYYVALETRRAIQQASIDLYFKRGRLMRTGRDGQSYRVTSIGMMSLLSEIVEFCCVRNGRERITDAPRPIISRLMCRAVGMRSFPEVPT